MKILPSHTSADPTFPEWCTKQERKLNMIEALPNDPEFKERGLSTRNAITTITVDGKKLKVQGALISKGATPIAFVGTSYPAYITDHLYLAAYDDKRHALGEAEFVLPARTPKELRQDVLDKATQAKVAYETDTDKTATLFHFQLGKLQFQIRK